MGGLVPGPLTPRQVSAAVQPLVGQAGGLAGQDAFANEIARAKAAEAALTQQIAALQASLLPLGTFTLDLNQSGNMF